MCVLDGLSQHAALIDVDDITNCDETMNSRPSQGRGQWQAPVNRIPGDILRFKTGIPARGHSPMTTEKRDCSSRLFKLQVLLVPAHACSDGWMAYEDFEACVFLRSSPSLLLVYSVESS